MDAVMEKLPDPGGNGQGYRRKYGDGPYSRKVAGYLQGSYEALGEPYLEQSHWLSHFPSGQNVPVTR